MSSLARRELPRGRCYDLPGRRAMVPAHNLPAALTSFVGRGHERAELERLVSSTRLLTLAGPGGVGKTRLALTVAADLVDQFAAGIRLVELAALSDPVVADQSVASAFGLYEQADRSPIDAVTAYLRERQLLLVLDNCEHLVRACADLATRLLRACPDLRILATSRMPLGVPGELVWRVPSLSLPVADGDRAEGDPDQPEAVQLFVARAREVRPAFALSGPSARAVAEICRRLDGIPLALELAAARVRVLAPEQIAARLDDRFRLLTGGSRAGMLRHQTLRGAIDWSHALLSEAARRLFRRLSVFVGGWTIGAAEHVCTDPSPLTGQAIGAAEILDLLTGLVDHSLIQADDQTGEARFHFLETIREYAHERLLEAGEADEYRDRHLLWYRDLAERFEREWVGPDQVAWLDRIERELDNVRAALDWSRAGGQFASGLDIASALRWFWNARGRFHEGRRRLGDLVERCQSAGADAELTTDSAAPPEALARALDVAGHLALMQGDYRTGRQYVDESLSITGALGLRPRALALRNLGLAATFDGDLDEAEALCGAGVQAGREQGDRLGTSHALFQWASIVHQRGDLARARALQDECLALRRADGDIWSAKNSLFELGNYALDQGEPDRAMRFYREALGYARDLRDVRIGGLILSGLAWAAGAHGQFEWAVRLLAAVGAWQGEIGFTLFPSHAALHDRTVAAARAALGLRRFDEVWESGRVMTFDQVVAEALATNPVQHPVDRDDKVASPGGQPSRPGAPARLTERECEVLRLMAEGLSNPEIARRLVLSPHTVRRHVANILGKLNLPTRAAAAAHAARHGLL